MQSPGVGSGVRCPFCSAPITIAGARYCAVCGRDMLTGAPNAGQAPPAAAPVYPQSPAYPAPASPYPPLAYPPQARAGMAVAMPGQVRVSAGRMIGLGFATLAVTLVVVYVVGANAQALFGGIKSANDIFFRFPMSFGEWLLIYSSLLSLYVYAALAGYLYVSRRLAAVMWWRATLESLALMALLAVIYVGALFVAFQTLGYDGPKEPGAAIWLSLEFAAAAMIGAGFASLGAPWKDIRARSGLRAGLDVGYTAALLAVMVAVMNWPDVVWHYIDSTPQLALDFTLFDVVNRLGSLVDICLAVGLVIVGALVTSNWLNRRLAQVAAPGWSPAPPLAPPVPPTPTLAPSTPGSPPAPPPLTLDPNQ